MRKSRRIKKISEKYPGFVGFDRELFEKELEGFLSKVGRSKANDNDIRYVITKLGWYAGTVYVTPGLLDHRGLDYGEEIYSNKHRLRKTRHKNANWAIKEDEFIRMYVMGRKDGFLHLMHPYGDMCVYDVVTVPEEAAVLKGNMLIPSDGIDEEYWEIG